jgi:hypothetical protein
MISWGFIHCDPWVGVREGYMGRVKRVGRGRDGRKYRPIQELKKGQQTSNSSNSSQRPRIPLPQNQRHSIRGPRRRRPRNIKRLPNRNAARQRREREWVLGQRKCRECPQEEERRGELHFGGVVGGWRLVCLGDILSCSFFYGSAMGAWGEWYIYIWGEKRMKKQKSKLPLTSTKHKSR